MTMSVADIRANLNENIQHAARIIGRSKDRRAVFAAIYRGKKKVKTVDDLMSATGLSHVRVLQEAGKLAGNGIVEKLQVDGRNAYRKDETYSQHKGKVLDLVDHPKKRVRYPTKQEPRVQGATTYQIMVSDSLPLPQLITVDDIEAFAEVTRVHKASTASLSSVAESQVKEFLKLVTGETHDYRDWGGEKNDLYTNRLRFRRARHAAAFAIKGKGTRGPLTPKKMGKNGDQLGRLFTSEAQLFFVVYHGKVDEAIYEQMRAYAVARALAGQRIYYCVIDGDDLARLIEAYPAEFAVASNV